MIQPVVTNDKQHSKSVKIVHTTIVRKYPSGKVERISPDISLEEVETLVPGKTSVTVGSNKDIETKEINNIPVFVEEQIKYETANYDDRYRPVPAGCQFEVKGGIGGASPCTIGAPAYHSKHGWMLVTAGHCFTEVAGSDDVMQPRDNWNDKHQIGYPEDIDFTSIGGNITWDAATIHTPDASITDAMAASGGGYDEWITGVETWDSIKYDLQGNPSKTVYRQGRSTGRNSGYIDDVSPSIFEFRNTANTKGGDSGGPHFRKTSGNEVSIVGIQSWGQDEYGSGSYRYSGGFSFEKIEDEYDLYLPRE